MIISTTDPITMNSISEPEDHPSIIEGKGNSAIRLYFESEDTRQIWLEICNDHESSKNGTS